MEKKKVEKKAEEKNLVATRGRIFKGNITKKFGHRAVIEFERTVKVPKFERFTKKKTRLHARIPQGMEVQIGDLVRVRECRPLSKIVRFVIIEKMNGETKE